ncbi:MAG: ZPR1 zinc finger domain-containing protein [Candidatus Thorarchaeota archaeon]|jgi:zinc finger protein
MSSEEHSIKCPSCGTGDLSVNSMLYTVPYFNEIAMFMMKCPKCNFSHNDVFSAEEYPPVRWTLKVNDPELLKVRVVRSGSGTIRFPELGIDIEPGPAAESYISNVEGVLYRTRPTVEFAAKTADHESERQKGKEVVEMMIKAIRGEMEFTMIIEDPMGVSGILPDDMRLVIREELSRDEASKLRGAPAWLDTVREEYLERKG